MKKLIKKNYKFILGMIIGLIWSSGIAYAATILFDSDEVSYDNTTSGLSATNVQSALDELYVESTSYQLFESRVSSIESKLYPIGSIYISTTITSASDVGTLLGGTWEAISQGRVLIGAGTNDGYTFTANSTGGSDVTQKNADGVIQAGSTNPKGEYAHKDTVDEMPSHNHSLGMHLAYKTSTWNLERTSSQLAWSASSDPSGSTGSSYYHNNIQPYLVVYMYKRTA